MSVSNYTLNQRISNLQYEIDQLTPPSGGYVPVNGNITINDIKTFSTLPQSSVVPVDNKDLVNKLYVDTHGGGSQNLSQVLTVGNSAGSSSINMNTNAISNISTATAKTSLIVDNSVVGQNSTLTTQNLTINNAGLSNTPIITLNQSGSGNGILIEEFYNQRTATTGEFNRMSFYAKSSAGVKTEYARIHQNAPVITTGSLRGRIDMAVQQGSGLVDYLTLNGQAGSVALGATLDCNSNNITECNTIQTPSGNYYLKGVNEYYNLPSNTSPSAVEDKLRWVGVNLGKANNWVQATSVSDFTSAGGGVENITASQYGFNGCWWVGTDTGYIYYSYDSGSTWSLLTTTNGRINCFQTYNSGGYMAVGGAFTSPYNYILSIDTGFSVNDITLGNGGLNNEVKCMWDNVGYGCLYIGGLFDDFFGGAGSFSNKFITWAYSSSTWYPFSNSAGSGFTGGNVYSITFETSSGFAVVGGDFSDVVSNGSSTGISYLFTFNTVSGYDVNSYFSIGTILNNPVSSVIPYNSGVLVGGSFSNPLTSPSWTDSYKIYITWTGTSWDLQNYPFSVFSDPVANITYIPTTGEYFTTIQSGGTQMLYKGSVQTPTIPVGSVWNCIAYNGSTTLYATNSQTSAGFLFYQLDQSVGITINATGGQTFNTDGGQGFTTINMFSIGSSFEMIYYIGSWWMISSNSCNFS